MKYFWNILGIILSLSIIYALYAMNWNSLIQEESHFNLKGYYIAQARPLTGVERNVMLFLFLNPLLFIGSLILEIKYPDATIGDKLCLKPKQNE